MGISVIRHARMTRRLLLIAPVAILLILYLFGEAGRHLLSLGPARTVRELLWDTRLMDILVIRRVNPGDETPPEIATTRLKYDSDVNVILPDGSRERDGELRGLRSEPPTAMELKFVPE
jgi:hypothetical protein